MNVKAWLADGDLWLKGDPTTTVMDVVLKGFNIQERQVSVSPPSSWHSQWSMS
jgi:hypothetical protein